MKSYKHHWFSEIENRLRTHGILWDFEGNAIRYDVKAKEFDFGIYTDKHNALIGRRLFDSNPSAKLSENTCNFCEHCSRIHEDEPLYRCDITLELVDVFEGWCKDWEHYKNN